MLVSACANTEMNMKVGVETEVEAEAEIEIYTAISFLEIGKLHPFFF